MYKIKQTDIPESVFQLARKWDEEEFKRASHSSKYEILSSSIRQYTKICEEISILANFRFTPYLNDEIQDFSYKLQRWLDQFETEEEQKLALLVASKITFVSEVQFQHLQEICFQEKLKFILLDEIIALHRLNPYDYESASKYFDSKLEECLFAPLTDSARINQFFHVNKLDNHSQLTLRSLDIFVHEEIMKDKIAVNSLNHYYKEKPILIILEDYSGSGKTITSDILRILKLYPCFKKIIFCPYIITSWAEELLYRIVYMVNPGVDFKIAYGMRLSDKMHCFSKSSVLFSSEQQFHLKLLCKKYHKRYFSNHRYIGKPRAYPYGYRNLQLLLVTQSNCPNHTLPIIWCTDGGWYPLFERVQRYA